MIMKLAMYLLVILASGCGPIFDEGWKAGNNRGYTRGYQAGSERVMEEWSFERDCRDACDRLHMFFWDVDRTSACYCESYSNDKIYILDSHLRPVCSIN